MSRNEDIFMLKTEGTNFDIPSQKIMDSMSDWVRVIDNEGKIVFANKAMKSNFEIDPIGKRYWDYSEEDIPHSITSRKNTFPGVVKEQKMIRERNYSVKSSPIISDDGYIYGTIEVFRDITKETEINRKLIRANKQINDEIHLARNIQHNMLPAKGTKHGIDIDYRYLSSEGLSGDIFDFITVDKDQTVIYIADVVGHGIAASILTMFVRQCIRNLLREYDDLDPKQALKIITSRFKDLNLDDDKYFTLFYAVYNNKTKVLKYANAGHNAIPILFNETNYNLLEAKGLPITAIFDDPEYKEHSIILQKKDQLLFYTDGLTESKNNKGEQFGLENLIKIVQSNCDYVLSNIIEALKSFIWGSLDDDIALLLVKIL